MKLSWQLGTFPIAIGRKPGESAREGAESWERGERETYTQRGLVSGEVFGIRRYMNAWVLTALECGGFRITDHEDLFKVMELAERLADLDWKGSPIEVAERNKETAREVFQEVGI